MTLARDISADVAIEPLLARLVERACRRVDGADGGAIALHDRDLDGMRTVVSCNMPGDAAGTLQPRGRGLMGRVLALDAPLHGRRRELSEPPCAAAEDCDLLAVPVRDHAGLIGVLAICAAPGRTLPATAQASVERLARRAARVIASATRARAQGGRAPRFELIVRVTGIIAGGAPIGARLSRAADAIHEILGFPNVEISLLDVDDPTMLVLEIRGGSYKRLGNRVARMSIEHGITGAAVRECRTQVVDDIRRDSRYVAPLGVSAPQAELAVPIMFADQVLGVLNVEGPRRFDALDVQSLEVIAEHLGLAIQNARLADESRQFALLEERQRLARELHDSVTQILSSISMMSQTLAASWTRDPAEGAIRTARLNELAQAGFAQCHELLGELSPVSGPRRGLDDNGAPARNFPALARLADLGLAGAVEVLVGSMLPAHMRCDLDFTGYRAQAMASERALLRMCQEAASNASRHANASQLRVEAGVDAGDAWLRVSDDGRGITAQAGPGRGIGNMWQRTLALGGSFRIQARSPRGILVEMRLPRQDRSPP